jgi:UrcA family protein
MLAAVDRAQARTQMAEINRAELTDSRPVYMAQETPAPITESNVPDAQPVYLAAADSIAPASSNEFTVVIEAARPLNDDTARVVYSDLSLLSAAGQAALGRRIDNAVEDVCHVDVQERQLRMRQMQRDCAQRASVDARVQMAAAVDRAQAQTQMAQASFVPPSELRPVYAAEVGFVPAADSSPVYLAAVEPTNPVDIAVVIEAPRPLNFDATRVVYSDLSLLSEAGQAALGRRIDNAVEDVCHVDSHERQLRMRQAQRDCAQRASVEARVQMAAAVDHARAQSQMAQVKPARLSETKPVPAGDTKPARVADSKPPRFAAL